MVDPYWRARCIFHASLHFCTWWVFSKFLLSAAISGFRVCGGFSTLAEEQELFIVLGPCASQHALACPPHSSLPRKHSHYPRFYPLGVLPAGELEAGRVSFTCPWSFSKSYSLVLNPGLSDSSSHSSAIVDTALSVLNDSSVSSFSFSNQVSLTGREAERQRQH